MMLFKEPEKLAMEALAKQKPVTLEQARAQASRVLARIAGKTRKQGNPSIDNLEYAIQRKSEYSEGATR